MRTHDDWPTDEAAASMIVQMHKSLTAQAVQAGHQKPDDMQKLPAQFPFFPVPAMMEGSSKGGVPGMPPGVPVMIPWMSMSGIPGIPGMSAASASASAAGGAPPTPTTPVSAAGSVSVPPTISMRSRSESTASGSATPTPAPASIHDEESDGQPTPVGWVMAIEGNVTVPEPQPTKAADEEEDEEPIDDNDQDEDYTGRVKKRKKPVRGPGARSRAQRRAAPTTTQASGDKGANTSRVMAPEVLSFPGAGMFPPGMFPPPPAGMQLPLGVPFAPPAGIQLPPGMQLQLPPGMQFPPLFQLPPGMQFPPMPIQPGQVIQVMVPDGKGGMQLVQVPMMPPGWTAEGIAEGGAAGDGVGHVEQSDMNGEELSIDAASNAEVAAGAVAAPLENGVAE
jgi:hypothetical protein